MELWTEYEGRTIDGAFPLKKLLRPEGRSAFFSTVNSKGVSTVIRLIESHFDEDEILSRWNKVETLNHPNLLKFEKCGQVILDETSVVYAVMEAVEANLGEVLSEQRLTVGDTRQLAFSLLASLSALHANGFVHEHIEAANIFAVGEEVKLRSDCIRELREGEDGVEAKRRDFQSLTVVLLQALTQHKTLETASRELPLPAPFDQIIRRGLTGDWGEREFAAALEGSEVKAAPAVPAAATPGPVPVPPAARAAASAPVQAPAPPSQIPVNRGATAPAPAPHIARPVRPVPQPQRVQRPVASDDGSVASGIPRFGLGRPGSGLMIALGLGVLLLLWLGWHWVSGPSTKTESDSQSVSQPAPDQENRPSKPTAGTESAGNKTRPVEQPAPSTPAPSAPVAAAPPAASGAVGGGWRVVAYTYNMEENAKKKVATIQQKHPDLQPQVFTPTGNSPFYIVLGGQMSKDAAYAFAERARHEGMPNDTFARNYAR